MNLSLQSQNKPAVRYGSFIRDLQELCPHIVFCRPRTDLCMICEDYKKKLNQIAADLDEKRDNEKSKIYREALVHIENAKRERAYYTACSTLAQEHYLKLGLKNIPSR